MAIRWHKAAAKELESLKPDLAERILGKIEECAINPQHFLVGLSGSKYYKLRVGDYRVIIEWDRKEKIMTILMIGHREEIYKRMDRSLDD